MTPSHFGVQRSMFDVRCFQRSPSHARLAIRLPFARLPHRLMKNLLLLTSLLAFLSGCASSKPTADADHKIKVLVLTGGHGFKAEPFFKMFQDNAEITYTAAAQTKAAEAYDRDDLFTYDVVVLYDSPSNITDAQKARFLALFDKGIGIVVLHHAYLSYPMWTDYERIAGGKYVYLEEQMTNGIKSSTYKGGVEIPVTVAAKNHPVSAGLQDFTVRDELYSNMHMLDNSRPLLKTGNDWLAWYRTEKKSRVVGTILGHGCYDDPNFRKFLAQSIRWTARR
jgi:type 1 glutamine amidotransferase